MEQQVIKIAIYGSWILDDRSGTRAMKEEITGNWESPMVVVYEGTRGQLWKQVKNLIRISRSSIRNLRGWDRQAARVLLNAMGAK